MPKLGVSFHRLKLNRAELAQRLQAAASTIPKDEKTWRNERDDWKAALSRSLQHTSSTKLVGLTIADRTINRNPQHKNFRLGWASIETLADWTGLSLRTISTTLAELESDGWIALKRGTGPGNSNKYTLCLERRLVSLELDSSKNPIAKGKHPQNLQGCASGPDNICPMPEKFDRNTGKVVEPIPQIVPPNPNNPIRPLRGRATALDHFKLAAALGQGDVELGYELMGLVTPECSDRLAVSLREGNATDEQIRRTFAAITNHSDARLTQPGKTVGSVPLPITTGRI